MVKKSIFQFFSIFITALLISFIMVSDAVSYAMLIFSGPLLPFLQEGISIILVGSVVVSFIVAIWGTKPGLIAQPQDTMAALLAIMCSSVATTLVTQNLYEDLFPTTVVLILVSSLLFGLSLLILGYMRSSRQIRFIPYPVIGGLLAGTGCLLIHQSSSVMMDTQLSWATLSLTNFNQWLHLLPGALFGTILFFMTKRFSHFLVVPILLIAAFFLFYIIFWIFNIPLSQDWLFGPLLDNKLWFTPHSFHLDHINWNAILSETGQMMAFIVTSIFSLFFNLTAFELIIENDIDIDRELRVEGLTNVVSSFLGGMGGYQSVSLSALAYKMKTPFRLVGVMCSLFCALILFFGGVFLNFMPKAILGGLIFSVGLSFLYEWAFRRKTGFSWIEHSIIWIMLLVIALIGFIEGILLGFALAILLFVINYSKVSLIKHTLYGSVYRSRMQRTFEEECFLEKQGKQILIIQLQGFLFFGTSNVLREKILNHIKEYPIKFLILDFQFVTGIDSSSILFSRRLIQVISDFSKITMILTNLNSNVRQKFNTLLLNSKKESILVFDTLDFGMEWCENELLKDSSFSAPYKSLEFFSDILGNLEKLEFSPGSYLFHQGEEAKDVYLIESGIVSVYYELPNGQKKRLRSMREGTLVGEIGFYLNEKRSASVMADERTVAYRMTKQQMDFLSSEHPHLAQNFHIYVARLLAERLTTANKTIDMMLD